tara:strand:- start:53 stop:259 length:207 start_codon:yes stop_codon:yes gene_type:complete
MIESKDLIVGVKYFLDDEKDVTGILVRKCEVENIVEFQTHEYNCYGKNKKGNVQFTFGSSFKYTAVEE